MPVQDGIDITFVLDRSRSSTKILSDSRGLLDTFGVSKRLIKDVVARVTPNSQTTAISFSDSATVEFGYKESGTPSSAEHVIAAVASIQAPNARDRGLSNLGDMLDTVRIVNDPKSGFGARPGAKRLVVLSTDGDHTGGDADPAYQSALKAFQNQVGTQR